MKTRNIRKIGVLATMVVGLSMTSSVSAAAPDGFGPWADGIATSVQGLRKNGTPVLPSRINLPASLGAAEGTESVGTYHSLGMGGSATYAFQNGISNGTFVVETTWTDFWYPTETAKVEISKDGISYQEIGSITKLNAEVKVPDGFGCALFARVTDTSNPDLFEATADGFDVDGIKSIGQPCITGGDIPACVNVSSSELTNRQNAVNKLRSLKSEKYGEYMKKASRRSHN